VYHDVLKASDDGTDEEEPDADFYNEYKFRLVTPMLREAYGLEAGYTIAKCTSPCNRSPVCSSSPSTRIEYLNYMIRVNPNTVVPQIIASTDYIIL